MTYQLKIIFDIDQEWIVEYEAEGYTKQGTLDGITKIWHEIKPTYDEAMNLYKLIKGQPGYNNLKIYKKCQDGNN